MMSHYNPSLFGCQIASPSQTCFRSNTKRYPHKMSAAQKSELKKKVEILKFFLLHLAFYLVYYGSNFSFCFVWDIS